MTMDDSASHMIKNWKPMRYKFFNNFYVLPQKCCVLSYRNLTDTDEKSKISQDPFNCRSTSAIKSELKFYMLGPLR